MYKHYLQDEPSVFLHSPVESARFGLAVGRLIVPISSELPDHEVFHLATQSEFDLVILRYSALRKVLTSQLLCATEPQIINAGKLVYYKWTLNVSEFVEQSRDGVEVRLLSRDGSISDLIRKTFESYSNHYDSNPRLRSVEPVVAYEEWANSILLEHDARTFVAVSLDSGLHVGFVVARIDAETRTAEILLNGIQPEFQRRGIYSMLLHRVADHLYHCEEVDAILISTQTTNYAVIAAWEGLSMEEQFVVETFHVMKSDIH